MTATLFHVSTKSSIAGAQRARIPTYEMLPSGIPGFQFGQFERLNVAYTRQVQSGFPPHRHAHFEIFWCTGGEAQAVIEGRQVSIKPKALFCINPGEVHNFISTQNLSAALLQFSPAFISTLDAVLPTPVAPNFWRPQSHPVLQLEEREPEVIQQIFANLADEVQSSAPHKESLIKAHLFLLFSKAGQFYQKRFPTEITPAGAMLTRRFQELVATQCPPLVSVKQFAERLDVSRSFLHRTVHRDTGESPSDLIHQRLMIEAKRQLLHTEAGLAKIARDLGFCDPSYFGRFFRRHTAMSPLQFRTHQRTVVAP